MTGLPRALTVAGSDSGGGAGIQADLKAFAARGVYGTSAVTAVTAQSTRGVFAVHHVPARIVRAQIDAVLSDIGVDAIKVGMLGRATTVRAVVAALAGSVAAGTPLVVDPVILASSGAELLNSQGVGAMIRELLPLATVLTPNLPEARLLLTRAGIRLPGESSDGELARALLALGPRSVVLTGGHREQPGDIYCDSDRLVELAGEHHDTRATHGSGCTHSAVLTAELARGNPPLQAATTAALITAQAIRNGLDQIGSGAGPVDVLGLSQRRD
jgi:hydroxymethylpyrimidine/phosphomethylpyrimidine kinase